MIGKTQTHILLPALLLCALLLGMLTACTAGKPAGDATAAQTETEQPETEQKEAEQPESEQTDGSEDGQNPVMNFVGPYGAARASALVEAEGAENARITVDWASSAAERSSWEMSGRFDTETLTVSYDNCRKTDWVFAADGSVESERVAYENGTGRIVFDGTELTFTWDDDQEHIADGLAFAFCTVPADGASLPDAQELAEQYFRMIGSLEKGTAGSTIAAAQAACAAVRFASEHALGSADTDALRDGLLEAWQSLTEEEQTRFDDSFLDVVRLIDSCAEDWSANEGVFADGGAADEMAALLEDPAAMEAWYTLRDHTLTMGNSDEG